MGRARKNSFHRTACETVHRKLGSARDILLRPCCDFVVRIPVRCINHTVASLRREFTETRDPRFTAATTERVTAVAKGTPITAVRSCIDLIRTCAGKLKRLALRL